MSASRDALHAPIDGLPDAELQAARRFLEFPFQEPIGPEFAQSVRRSIGQLDAGDTIVCHCTDMVAKLLDRE